MDKFDYLMLSLFALFPLAVQAQRFLYRLLIGG